MQLLFFKHALGLSVSQASVNFGSVAVNAALPAEQTVTVELSGDQSSSGLYAFDATLEGTNASDFTLTKDTAFSGSLAMGSTESVTVVPKSTATPGNYMAQLKFAGKAINDNATVSETVPVTVTGGSGGNVSVTGVTLNKNTTSIAVGGNETLIATVAPSDADNKSVTWSSSNTAIATISTSGKLTGVAAGEAIITVKTVDGNKTAACTVTVSDAAAGDTIAVSGNDAAIPELLMGRDSKDDKDSITIEQLVPDTLRQGQEITFTLPKGVRLVDDGTISVSFVVYQEVRLRRSLAFLL